MAQQEQCAPSDAWAKIKSRLRAELGEDVFASWFRGVELEQVDDEVVHLTVATRFLRNWLTDALLRLRAQIGARGMAGGRARRIQGKAAAFRHRGRRASSRVRGGWRLPIPTAAPEAAPLPMPLRTGYGGFEGSPLDPRLSFTSFVVGASNRLAHAAAQEVAAPSRRRSRCSIRCSSTAMSASARRICCTPSPGT